MGALHLHPKWRKRTNKQTKIQGVAAPRQLGRNPGIVSHPEWRAGFILLHVNQNIVMTSDDLDDVYLAATDNPAIVLLKSRQTPHT